MLVIWTSFARAGQRQGSGQRPRERSRRTGPPSASPPGSATGPEDILTAGSVASGTVQPLDPDELLERVQLASRCGVRLVLGDPPPAAPTTNRETVGPFSVDSARRATDRYAAVLTADTLRKYRPTLIGLNLADDYGCKECWDGKVITQAQIADWVAYARAKLPGLPLGVRRTPDWVAEYPALAPRIDYVWAQYHTRRGDPVAYFDDAAAIAGRLGLRVVMGVNVHDCHGAGTTPCTATEADPLRHPRGQPQGQCAFLNWRYHAATWQRAEIRAAGDGLRGPCEGALRGGLRANWSGQS